jgi:hypothetical protein
MLTPIFWARWMVILKYLVSQIIISKGKCISLVLSAEGLGNSTKLMIKHNFLLWGILELKLNPRRRVYVLATF